MTLTSPVPLLATVPAATRITKGHMSCRGMTYGPVAPCSGGGGTGLAQVQTEQQAVPGLPIPGVFEAVGEVGEPAGKALRLRLGQPHVAQHQDGLGGGGSDLAGDGLSMTAVCAALSWPWKWNWRAVRAAKRRAAPRPKGRPCPVATGC